MYDSPVFDPTGLITEESLYRDLFEQQKINVRYYTLGVIGVLNSLMQKDLSEEKRGSLNRYLNKYTDYVSGFKGTIDEIKNGEKINNTSSWAVLIRMPDDHEEIYRNFDKIYRLLCDSSEGKALSEESAKGAVEYLENFNGRVKNLGFSPN